MGDHTEECLGFPLRSYMDRREGEAVGGGDQVRLHRFKVPLKAKSKFHLHGRWMSSEVTPRKLPRASVVDGRRACPRALHSPAAGLQPIRWAAIRTRAVMLLGALMKCNREEIPRDLNINPKSPKESVSRTQ